MMTLIYANYSYIVRINLSVKVVLVDNHDQSTVG